MPEESTAVEEEMRAHARAKSLTVAVGTRRGSRKALTETLEDWCGV